MENTILVAEDSKTMKKMIVNVLKNNYHMLEAENRREAPNLLQDSQNHISAVIIDLVMPEMDGHISKSDVVLIYCNHQHY